MVIGINPQAMEYFVTGGTGNIGTFLVQELIHDGHDVSVLTRSRSNASHLPEDATVVEGDITSPETIRDPIAGVDGVFHLGAWAYVGPGRENVERAEQVNVEGTRNVLELIRELDIPKAVYTSTVGVYGDTGGETIDESYNSDTPLPAVYARTKWEAHYEVARPMIEDGLPLVVVLPGHVLGRYDKEYGAWRAVFRDYLEGDLPFIPRGFLMPFEHAEDSARSHIQAMEDGDAGEEYIIASETRSLVDVFDQAEAITGVAAPRAISPKVFTVLAGVMDIVERVASPPEGLEAESLRVFAGPKVPVENSKAKRELGIEHRPFEDGLREYLEWEMDQLGMQR